MPLANCPRCGSLFNQITTDYCKKCYDEEEELLRQTQDFLRKNRAAAVFEILEEVELEQWMLDKWVAEQRITLSNPADLQAIPRCSSCGREIKQGEEMCQTCKFKKLTSKKPSSQQEKPAEEEKDKPARTGMHFKSRS